MKEVPKFSFDSPSLQSTDKTCREQDTYLLHLQEFLGISLSIVAVASWMYGGCNLDKC